MFGQVLFILHILICLLLIMLVLVQQGKGATAGSSFGGGVSQTVFGSQGSGNFLFKLTTLLAVLFFANSLCLVYLVAKSSGVADLLNAPLVAPADPIQPAIDAGTQPSVPVDQ